MTTEQDGRRKGSDEQVIECLEAAYGIVAQAARELGKRYGIRYSRSGLKKRIDASPKLKAARADAEAAGVDFAEAGLLAAIKAGKVQAIIFYLQTRSEKYRPRIDVAEPKGPRDEAAILADLARLGFSPAEDAGDADAPAEAPATSPETAPDA